MTSLFHKIPRPLMEVNAFTKNRLWLTVKINTCSLNIFFSHYSVLVIPEWTYHHFRDPDPNLYNRTTMNFAAGDGMLSTRRSLIECTVIVRSDFVQWIMGWLIGSFWGARVAKNRIPSRSEYAPWYFSIFGGFLLWLLLLVREFRQTRWIRSCVVYGWYSWKFTQDVVSCWIKQAKSTYRHFSECRFRSGRICVVIIHRKMIGANKNSSIDRCPVAQTTET